MADTKGPVFTGQFEEFVVTENGESYTILYLADANNDDLQAEGKPPSYYWVPGKIRLAQQGDTGDYMFRHMHFVGVFNDDVNVGIEKGQTEVSGGLLSFTTTSRYPTSVLKKAQKQLLERFKGSDDKYWGWRSPAAPRFAMLPIISNNTYVTNLSPGRNGIAPAQQSSAPSAPAATGSPTTSGSGAPPSVSTPPPATTRDLIGRADPAQKIQHNREVRSSSAIDAWAWNLQGQGPGSTTGGENAFSGMIGPFASELVWAGFHGTYSPIAVSQDLVFSVWSQTLSLTIIGDWENIYNHFSTK
ncbi:MAG: hypothetical protein ABG776_16290, partial [Cyanobacteria bacterium J06555_13]